ncbi:(d)CMP kinase [Kiloniella sp. b19]|uniref:(d)CMP kinase n=1 Tax=Kiloniella sp. GXU_MW_B19 TaxID=3141326 RepID=UPI0031D7A22F
MSVVIAIDGPAAAGKGTLARRLADSFGLAYLDTGAIYRATAARLLAEGGDPNDSAAALASARSLSPEDLERTDLRTEAVSQATSIVAANQDVRAALLEFQRSFANQAPAEKVGAVLDGRDIGTVICPDADVKLFITASDEVRAERRYKELLAKGEEAIYARVLEDLQARDKRDSSRATAPLKAAEDAVTLDTSALDIETVFGQAAQIISDRTGLEQRI